MGKIIAIIEKSEDGGYGIYAPDFKGLFGYGETEEEAKVFVMQLKVRLNIMKKTGKTFRRLCREIRNLNTTMIFQLSSKHSRLSTLRLLPVP